MPRIAIIVTLLLALAPPAHAGCRSEQAALISFPPAGTDGGLPEPRAILSLLAGKGWGIAENVRIVADETAPVAQVLEARLPQGSLNPKHKTAPKGGMGFRWKAGIPAGATTACLSYGLWLAPDFAFNKGGKLPGLFGGSGPAGGKLADGQNGFSVRLMWRSGGAGEIYAYIPGHPDKRGRSIERGAFYFPRARWIAVELEVGLNSPGNGDGILRLAIDGEVKIALTEVFYRSDASLGIDGVMADIFYGGKDLAWAAPHDTTVRLTPFELSWR